MNYQLNKNSQNSKTGKIAVSYSNKNTCPDTCPLKSGGCYAFGFYTNLHWEKITRGERGENWSDFLESVETLKRGEYWRHNVTGDLNGSNGIIDTKKLKQLVKAQKGRKGFTYTHYLPTIEQNAQAIEEANKSGFIVNLSANNLEEADNYSALNIAPVVVVLPQNAEKVTMTPGGRKVVRCPAYLESKDITCADCLLCAKNERDYIIGFPAHGTKKKQADIIARG